MRLQTSPHPTLQAVVSAALTTGYLQLPELPAGVSLGSLDRFQLELHFGCVGYDACSSLRVRIARVRLERLKSRRSRLSESPPNPT